MEHKIILKCRVCLDEFEEEKMFELFKDTKSNYNDVAVLQLYEKVEYCCGVKIRESSEMPSKICLKCYDLTRIWYNFRQLCVNSQVYLESLCTDSHLSNGADVDSEEYLHFLFEDLQSFRMAARKENDALQVNGHNTESASDKEDDSDSDDEQYEDIPIVADESDAELEDIIHNIKREHEATDRQKAKDQVDKNEVDRTTGKKRPRISVKKVTKLQKKAFRPPSPASYMCSVCGNVYAKKSSFTYHMSLHTNVKAHECELCGKSFRQTCELKNHMRRHTGERPYKCSFCDRCFIDRSEKHRHERVHTNTRPYVCNVCGKSFMYSAILKNHSKLHSGEKDFNCLVCQKAFTLQHQLKAHLQTITHKQKEAQFVGAGYEVVYE